MFSKAMKKLKSLKSSFLSRIMPDLNFSFLCPDFKLEPFDKAMEEGIMKDLQHFDRQSIQMQEKKKREQKVQRLMDLAEKAELAQSVSSVQADSTESSPRGFITMDGASEKKTSHLRLLN